MASALSILPLTTSLAALLAVALVAGFMAGGVDVGGNVLTVWRIRSGLGSFMSFLHFSFGVGTFLAPVILAQSVAWSDGIRWGYWCLAIATLPVAILVMRRPSPEPHASDDKRDGSRPNRALIGLTALFLMLYVAAEVGFGNWIYTYALEQGLANEVSAGYLTSAYWGAYTLGRLASVVVSARVRPGLLLGAALGMAGASVLLLWIVPASGAVTWVCTMVFGVALAPIFPVMVTFAGERTMITGGVTSLFLVGASVGAMSLPWIIGQAFGPYGPTVVPALVLIDILLLVGVFLIVTVRYGQASTT
jgi:fucose permease